jgi:hypothetical protein
MNTPALLVIGIVVAVAAPASAQLSAEAAIAKAEAIFKNFQEGKTAEIVKEFDARMAAEVPEEKLKPMWTTFTGKFGAFKGIDERREGQMEGRQAVELFLSFEKDKVLQRVVFDNAGKVAGLVFRPVSASVLPPKK